MRDVKKIERKLCITNSAAAKIFSIANKKDKDKNKILAAKQMLVYYLGDILVILRKDSYTPDDILLLILKTSMCLNAIRYLFQATLGTSTPIKKSWKIKHAGNALESYIKKLVLDDDVTKKAGIPPIITCRCCARSAMRRSRIIDIQMLFLRCKNYASHRQDRSA